VGGAGRSSQLIRPLDHPAGLDGLAASLDRTYRTAAKSAAASLLPPDSYAGEDLAAHVGSPALSLSGPRSSGDRASVS
jgi:hypothetical protein